MFNFLGMLNRKSYVTDGQDIMYSSLMLYFWNNVADVMPHCAKVVHLVPPGEKNVIMSNILCIPPAFPNQPQGLLPMVINWTLTPGLVSSQVQP